MIAKVAQTFRTVVGENSAVMAAEELHADSTVGLESKKLLSLLSGHGGNIEYIKSAIVAEALTLGADHLVPVGGAGRSNFEIVENALFASTLIFLQGIASLNRRLPVKSKLSIYIQV